MKWLFRPSVLVVLSLALVAGAVAVWVRFRPDTGGGPQPLPVAAGDREIVWLAQATASATWERFVSALKLTEDRLKDKLPGLHVDIDPARTFPQQSTAVPEATMTWDGAGGKLVFRWYKLTSKHKVSDWVPALLKDRPVPLAIIGGSNSDNARDLALQLRAATTESDEKRPLLFLTTATADKVRLPRKKEGKPDPVARREELDLETAPAPKVDPPQFAKLHDLYPGRTFRFCFNNHQMSKAITEFIWSRADLRPSGPPTHLVRWEDDTYSADLLGGFIDAIGDRDKNPAPFSTKTVESSVGSFHSANRWERMQVADFLSELDTIEPRDRRLLVLAGQSIPSRRFLGELARTAPALTRNLVVASGDAIAFNTIYRDRMVSWPIQDLPFPLVFFCHAAPTDIQAGFTPQKDGLAGAREVGDTGATGTEDVLLYVDLISALVHASARPALADAPHLAARLRSVRYQHGSISLGSEGRVFFESQGDRADGTGEHVVWLQPQFEPTGRIKPLAHIDVFMWTDTTTGRDWEQRGDRLEVKYETTPATRGEPR
jgi:hypothetical protein